MGFFGRRIFKPPQVIARELTRDFCDYPKGLIHSAVEQPCYHLPEITGMITQNHSTWSVEQFFVLETSLRLT